jgi:hypothetical protein
MILKNGEAKELQMRIGLAMMVMMKITESMYGRKVSGALQD